MPKKTLRGNVQVKGWFNDNIMNIIKSRDRTYQRATLTREDWNDYKRKRNTACRIIKNSKSKYPEKQIDDCKFDSTSMRKTL